MLSSIVVHNPKSEIKPCHHLGNFRDFEQNSPLRYRSEQVETEVKFLGRRESIQLASDTANWIIFTYLDWMIQQSAGLNQSRKNRFDDLINKLETLATRSPVRVFDFLQMIFGKFFNQQNSDASFSLRIPNSNADIVISSSFPQSSRDLLKIIETVLKRINQKKLKLLLQTNIGKELLKIRSIENSENNSLPIVTEVDTQFQKNFFNLKSVARALIDATTGNNAHLQAGIEEIIALTSIHDLQDHADVLSLEQTLDQVTV